MEPPTHSVRSLRYPRKKLVAMTVRVPENTRDLIYTAGNEHGIPPALLARRALYLGLKKAIREADMEIRG